MTSVFELQRIVIDFQDPDAFLEETCTICLETFDRETLRYSTPPVALDCDHFTCTECLHAYMAAHLSKDHRNNRSFELRCPAVTEEEEECSEVYAELDFLRVGRRVGHQLWLKRRTLASVRTRHYCANPRCATIILPEGSSSEDMIDLPCSACEARNCLICKTLMHPGLTCEANSFSSASENDRTFRAVVTSRGFQECSQCGATVERTEGCSSMLCLCGHRFCYHCGEPSYGMFRHVCVNQETDPRIQPTLFGMERKKLMSTVLVVAGLLFTAFLGYGSYRAMKEQMEMERSSAA